MIPKDVKKAYYSLIDRIAPTPKNIYEFAEKARKRGAKSIDIVLESLSDDQLSWKAQDWIDKARIGYANHLNIINITSTDRNGITIHQSFVFNYHNNYMQDKLHSVKEYIKCGSPELKELESQINDTFNDRPDLFKAILSAGYNQKSLTSNQSYEGIDVNFYLKTKDNKLRKFSQEELKNINKINQDVYTSNSYIQPIKITETDTNKRKIAELSHPKY